MPCAQAEDSGLLGPLQSPDWVKVYLVSTVFFLPVSIVPGMEKCPVLCVGDRVLCLWSLTVLCVGDRVLCLWSLTVLSVGDRVLCLWSLTVLCVGDRVLYLEPDCPL